MCIVLLRMQPQSNKETKWNNQPLSCPILFQNEIQKPGQKALKKIEKHDFYFFGHSESPRNLIFYYRICFFLSLGPSLNHVVNKGGLPKNHIS